MTDPSGHFVFAAVPYANALPLAHFLPQSAGVKVVLGPPATLADRLLAGEVDVAMLPAAAFLQTPGLAMIDGMGICADGRVWSVLLKCRRPLPQVRRVALDKASRSSNALAEILLRDHFDLDVDLTAEAAEADAQVVIGDRALCLPPAPGGDLDLAAAWKEMTALPFVFAVWAFRAEHPAAGELASIAVEALQTGQRHVDLLAAVMAGRLNLPRHRCHEYLSSVIRYELGPREKAGMRRFEKLLARAEAVPQ